MENWSKWRGDRFEWRKGAVNINLRVQKKKKKVYKYRFYETVRSATFRNVGGQWTGERNCRWLMYNGDENAQDGCL